MYNNIEPEHIFISPYIWNDDSMVQKMKVDKIIQENVNNFLLVKDFTSKTLRTKKNSSNQINSKIEVERIPLKRNFEVSFI